jgi:carbamoyltransferase
MRILGLYDDHNCGAAVIEDGKILAAIEEERLSRIKLHDGNGPEGPGYRSLEAVLKMTNSSPDNIDRIALAIQSPGELMKYVMKDMFRKRTSSGFWLFCDALAAMGQLLVILSVFHNWWRIVKAKKLLRQYGFENTPIELVDHHTAHAASA